MVRKGFLLASVLLLLNVSSFAQESDPDNPKWTIWAGGIVTIPDGELRLDRGGRKVVEIDVEGGTGYQFGLEYRINEKIGLGLSVTQSDMEYLDNETFATGEILQSSDELKFTLVAAEFNYHLLKNRRLDPYLMMSIGYTSYGKEMQITTELPSSDLGPNPSPELVAFELHKGVNIGIGSGLNFKVRKNWAIGLKTQIILSNLEASIIDDPEADGRDIDLDVNPIIWSLNISKSF